MYKVIGGQPMKHFTIFMLTASALILCILFLPVYKINADANYPEKFDLRDYSLVSEVKNQGQYNMCWAFSALGSIETQLLKLGYSDRDLSEWHLAYSSYNSIRQFPKKRSAYDEGGSSNIASAVLSRWDGLCYEADMPYDIAEEDITGQIKPSPPIYYVQDIYNVFPWISQKKHHDVSYIKSFIYSKNSVSSTCSIDDKYYNAETASLYCNNKDYNCNNDKYYHSVLIIGWDDNYPRENFYKDSMPDHNGAWLVRNSWGTNWGSEGYFWISYEDCSLLEAVVYSSENSVPYQNNYQYDDFGWSTSISSNILLEMSGAPAPQTTTGYMANIFECVQDEYVSAVSFYTIEENVKYEVTVYSNLTDISDPVSGTASSVTSGTQKYPGYHTIILNDKVKIKESEQFSIVLKITNNVSPYTIPIDASILVYPLIQRQNLDSMFNVDPTSIMKNSYKDESFISYDGNEWSDIYRKSILARDLEGKNTIAPDVRPDEILKLIRPGNICLKAFTTAYSPCKGDINDDGVVTSKDIFILADIILGKGKPSVSQQQYADMNNDGTINITDITALIKYIISF